MSDDALRSAVVALLGDLAPEADLDALAGGAPLRDALDLDSFDFLTFVTRLHAATGVEVPEAHYPRLATLDGCVAYLRERGGRA